MTTTTTPLVSIAVLSWNSKELTRECIASILQNVRDVSFELIIIDNASTDGSCEMLAAEFSAQRDQRIRLFFNTENKKFAGGNNQALQHARGKYFLLLNSDTMVHPGSTEAMARFLEMSPHYGAVTAKLLNTDGSVQYYMHRRFPTALRLAAAIVHKRFLWFRPRIVQEYCYLDKNFTEDFDVEQAAGACVMVRRDILDTIGGLFDEKHFALYYNDVDLCTRLWQSDFRIRCLTSIAITHAKGTSVRSLSFVVNSAEYVSSSLAYFRLHHHSRSFRILQMLYFILFFGMMLISPFLMIIRRLSFFDIPKIFTIIRIAITA